MGKNVRREYELSSSVLTAALHNFESDSVVCSTAWLMDDLSDGLVGSRRRPRTMCEVTDLTDNPEQRSKSVASLCRQPRWWMANGAFLNLWPYVGRRPRALVERRAAGPLEGSPGWVLAKNFSLKSHPFELLSLFRTWSVLQKSHSVEY